jgi:hypothetical protein
MEEFPALPPHVIKSIDAQDPLLASFTAWKKLEVQSSGQGW